MLHNAPLADLLSEHLFRVETDRVGVVLRDDLAKDDKNRRKLLAAARAGEPVELDVGVITFSQGRRVGVGRNTKNVRFSDVNIDKVAASAIGNPFLRDHKQLDVLSRAGTILDSAFEPDGELWVLKQTLKAIKPWAVEGLLDGTIDRFSIGIRPVGAIRYSHNGEEIEGWPEWWPGDKLEDGTIVEWVFDDAVLVESSAVNVPAADFTGVHEIRAALSASLGTPPGPPKSIHFARKSSKENAMDPKLIAALKLGDKATAEDALRAVEELTAAAAKAGKVAELETELSAAKSHNKRLTEELSAIDKERREAEGERVDAVIAKLYDEAKLVKVRGEGDEEQPDELEEQLRDLHESSGWDKFKALADALRPRHSLLGETQDKKQEAEKASTKQLSAPEVPAWKKPLRVTKEVA